MRLAVYRAMFCALMGRLNMDRIILPLCVSISSSAADASFNTQTRMFYGNSLPSG
jgi:hypothetical protein